MYVCMYVCIYIYIVPGTHSVVLGQVYSIGPNQQCVNQKRNYTEAKGFFQSSVGEEFFHCMHGGTIKL